MNIFVDTSALLAVLNADDDTHARSISALHIADHWNLSLEDLMWRGREILGELVAEEYAVMDHERE